MAGSVLAFRLPSSYRAELDKAWGEYYASLSNLKPFTTLLKEESDVLRALPATMREIAAITGRTPHQVNASLDWYRRKGLVKRGRTVPTGHVRGPKAAAIWERVE